jgi:hypothetical protein
MKIDWRWVLSLALCASSPALGQAGKSSATPSERRDHLTFQTHAAWMPRTNVNAGAVMVYGLETTPEELKSWRAHGYITELMTGVAWGHYLDYLDGRFDGKKHWDEAQKQADGQIIQHGKDVPYMSPGENFGRYLGEGVKRLLDHGVTAIYLEEPEFWAQAGWSEGFKREWQAYYGEPWQAPNSSPDAQYRASKLKYMLYRRALAQVFSAVAEYGRQHGRHIPCYVATHSLLNYSQWGIVSPESSLIGVGADGYIAQVWTGTSRTPNSYNGVVQERTFETAFLEYGTMQNLVRGTTKRMWFLNDPIEDNPHHTWDDYRNNWQNTLVASLLQDRVKDYEVLPWPERIFGDGKKYAAGAAGGPNVAATEPIVIPQSYTTELQVTFDALRRMGQSTVPSKWLQGGTQGIGILVSDTMMFQRADPQSSDAKLGSFYGLAMPLVARGIPVQPMQIENVKNAAVLQDFKVLLLTYEGQKPPTPEFHLALAEWVRNGGALLVVDKDTDPYLKVREWWNTGANHYATPREHLFEQLGLDADSSGIFHVGKGWVCAVRDSPADLSHDAQGGEKVSKMVREIEDKISLPWSEAAGFALQRGPYVVAAGLDTDPATKRSYTLPGGFIDLFDAELPVLHDVVIEPGSRHLLLDLKKTGASTPRVLALSGKISKENLSGDQLSFTTEGIANSKGVARIGTAGLRVTSVDVDGKTLPSSAWSVAEGTLLMHYDNGDQPRHMTIRFGSKE